MILYDENIVSTLSEYILNDNQYVDSILLSSYGFGIQFCDVNIHCNESVYARIDGRSYKWNDAPSSAPWGQLGRQKVIKVELTFPELLRITFESDDFIEIQTVEGEYESVIIKLPSTNNNLRTETY